MNDEQKLAIKLGIVDRGSFFYKFYRMLPNVVIWFKRQSILNKRIIIMMIIEVMTLSVSIKGYIMIRKFINNHNATYYIIEE